MPVLALIKVDAYPFLVFRDLTSHLKDMYFMDMYFVAPLWQLILRRPRLDVATKRLLHQQVKVPG